MDGVIDELLRLEDAKCKALIEFDSSAYSEYVESQNRLLNDTFLRNGVSRNSTGKLVELSKLLRLNSALYHNLLSISPWLALADASYTPAGQAATVCGPNRFAAEA